MTPCDFLGVDISNVVQVVTLGNYATWHVSMGRRTGLTVFVLSLCRFLLYLFHVEDNEDLYCSVTAAAAEHLSCHVSAQRRHCQS